MIVSEKLSNVLSYFVFFAFLGLFILGCNHGHKKHGVELEATNLLLSFYYGAEYFWHKTSVEEINGNVRVAISLVFSDIQMADPSEQLKLNKAKKEFKKNLANCDLEEIAYIKEMTKAILEIKNDIDRQYTKALLNAKQTHKFDYKLSDTSTILMNKLSKNGFDNEVKNIQLTIKDITKYRLEEGNIGDPIWIEDYLKEYNVEEVEQNSIAKRQSVFIEIFE